MVNKWVEMGLNMGLSKFLVMSRKRYEDYYGDRMVALNEIAVHLTSFLKKEETYDACDEEATIGLVRLALKEDIACSEEEPEFDKRLSLLISGLDEGGSVDDQFKGELRQMLLKHHAAAEEMFRNTWKWFPVYCYDGEESWLLKLKSFALEAVEPESVTTPTRFSPEIKCVLLESFSKSAYPSDAEKWRLVKQTGTSFQQVSVWFSNQRMRNKAFQEANMLPLKNE